MKVFQSLKLGSKWALLLCLLAGVELLAQTAPVVQSCNNSSGYVTIAGSYDGTLVLAGETVSGSATTSGLFVARFDTSGDLVWATLLTDYAVGTDIKLSLDSSDHAILTLTYPANLVEEDDENLSIITIGTTGSVSLVIKGSIPIGG